MNNAFKAENVGWLRRGGKMNNALFFFFEEKPNAVGDFLLLCASYMPEGFFLFFNSF
ncbi:MAG: hypothetical protein FWD14_05010 [Treponema sp.]|nr:hypothetical protein [Treponema sp.]